MKTKSLFAICFVFLLAAGAAQAQSPQQTTVPRLVQFSGTIKNSAGKPASGIVSTTFALYKDELGGDALWVETQNVQADADGHYTVFLGANTPEGLPLGVFATGEARWLGVQPALPGVGEQPRVLVVGVPYAMKAADADTLGGKPASAYLLAPTAPQAPSQAPVSIGVPSGDSTATPTSSPTPVAAASAAPSTSCKSIIVTGAGMTGYIPTWTGTSGNCATGLGQSNVFQASTGYIGIGNTSPAGPLDLTGNAFIRGTLQLPSLGTSTATTGYNSQPLDFLASSFASNDATPIVQHFRWQAEPVSNDTSSPSGKFDLLYGIGTSTPAETGLSISSAGIFTFAPGQTFPGTGTGTVTSVGLALTGPLFTVSGSPVTTSGTLTGTLNAQAAHSVFAGPSSGSAAPTFRALTTADLPAGTGTVTSVGSGAGLTGGPITTTGTLSIATAGVTNAMLANSSVTVTAGTGLSGGGTVALGGSTTLTNAGVTGITAGTDITTSGATGNVTVNVNTAALASLFAPAGSYAPATGSANYIQNQSASPQASANFNISGTGTATTFNSTNPYQIGGTNVLTVDGSLDNVFVGSPEPASITGNFNTALGTGTLAANTSGYYNTASGISALASNTTGNDNTASGVGALDDNTTGYENTASGAFALYANTTGYENAASGYVALANNTTGGFNTANGGGALSRNTTGDSNTASGTDALVVNTTGTNNVAVGVGAGYQLTTGNSNTLLGYLAGYNFTGAESNNIDIGSQGATGESGVIRIGTAGTQTATYIAGINGVTPSGSPLPVVINSSGQLGTGATAVGTITGITAGTGLTGGGSSGNVTLNVDETVIATQAFANNAATMAQNNAETYASNLPFLPLAGGTLTGGLIGTTANFGSVNSTYPYNIGGTNVLTVDSSLENVFVGGPEQPSITGNSNTALGYPTLFANTTGYNNTGVGSDALYLNTTGNSNTAVGDGALLYNMTGNTNVALGTGAGGSLAYNNSKGGSGNIMLGYDAGANFDANESNNIDIGNLGVTGESGVIRIGDTAAQDSCTPLPCQTATYIAGINGVTVSGGSTVLINSSGQLGTVSSSRRYKEDIQDMGAASDGLLRLRPVTFRYKKPSQDGSKPIQYGLIAEEVAEVYPDLVVRGKDGQIETVQYYKLDAMLLNEIQKLSKAKAADQTEMEKLARANAADEAEIANLKKQSQEQQAAIKQLLAQVQSIQQTVAKSGNAQPRQHAANTTTKTPKPEPKRDASQATTSLLASGK